MTKITMIETPATNRLVQNAAKQHRSLRRRACLLLITVLLAPLAQAARVTLDFEGFASFEGILDYYDGGAGHLGAGPGPDLGIRFDIAASQTLPITRLANFPSPVVVMIWDPAVGTVMTMNVADGFNGPVRFDYTSENFEIRVSVFSEPDGTGMLLDSVLLNPIVLAAANDPSDLIDTWVPIEMTFPGTARSLVFESVGTQQPGSQMNSRGFITVDDLSIDLAGGEWAR